MDVAAVLAMFAPRLSVVQTWYCDRPQAPYMPYGATADELEWTGIAVDTYVREMQEYLDCLAMEADDASSEANDLIREWNALVSYR